MYAYIYIYIYAVGPGAPLHARGRLPPARRGDDGHRGSVNTILIKGLYNLDNIFLI